MKLPQDFLDQMEPLLTSEYEQFKQALAEKSYAGLRVNTLKTGIKEFIKQCPFELDPVPWVEEGFYYQDDERPGKHPFYHAGLFYLQEPSAMAPVAILNPRPGDKVLDLCAAPGGKTTQIGARLKGEGILVANDINRERIKPLVKNLELFGITNCLVTNEEPEKLAGVFPGYFDKILIDAPCSGEGMFRKDPSLIRSWESFRHIYGATQEQILENAAKMLKPGGLLLYSTCTFNPEENEGQIKRFIANQHNEFTIEAVTTPGEYSRGRPDWVNGEEDLAKTVRLWPHRVKGEGHYAALLKKQEVNLDEELAQTTDKRRKATKLGSANSWQKLTKGELEVVGNFWANYVKIPLSVNLVHIKNYVYNLREDLPDLSKIKVIRPGWYLGELKKARFEPSQGLAMALTKEDFLQVIDLPVESDLIDRYLKGETLVNEVEFQGWTVVCVAGHPLGWAKGLGSQLKNYYQKSWRKT